MYKYIIKNIQGEIVLTSYKSFKTVSEALSKGLKKARQAFVEENFFGSVDVIAV